MVVGEAKVPEKTGVVETKTVWVTLLVLTQPFKSVTVSETK